MAKPAKMPTLATAATTALAPSLFRSPLLSASIPLLPPPPPSLVPTQIAMSIAGRRPCVSCQVAVTTGISSSSSSAEHEAEEAAASIGKRVRVTVPLKVYHVVKAPELELNGLEGVVKQYAGVWKGKSVSANLPFKVEFQIEVVGQPRPVKFVAHLKEDEFEYLSDD